ncbi:tyrosine-protein phosphatase [Rhizohabitans arisaemae]|uniref:tyrosine-protein phosphatase n=1 Tax=Rhizohabitans arisaemae TaxID=2720610 RepID=UPI0024B0B944|nr:tyrosine-protein phosphatase [Rhizohabitans arisaemae]
MTDRHLDWEGCYNARDLGGMRTAGGHTIRRGAVVRSDELDRITREARFALVDHGVRTIVDLRDDDERELALRGTPELAFVHVPLHDRADAQFRRHCLDDGLDGTPLYFRPFLELKPERCVAAVAAVARARPGGVLIHSGLGRDRAGLLTLVLLVLAGVDAGSIADDYDLSAERLPALWLAAGLPDQGHLVKEQLVRHHTTAREVIVSLIESLDIPGLLRTAGLSHEDVAALRARMLVAA